MDAPERSAREYLKSLKANPPVEHLTLVHVTENAALNQEWARNEPDADPGIPATILTFEVAEDRNVVEVFFQNGRPVAWDYH